MKRPDGYAAVAATCPALDRIRRHANATGGAPVSVLIDIEEVRAANTQLRQNSALWETRAKELERVLGEQLTAAVNTMERQAQELADARKHHRVLLETARGEVQRLTAGGTEDWQTIDFGERDSVVAFYDPEDGVVFCEHRIDSEVHRFDPCRGDHTMEKPNE